MESSFFVQLFVVFGAIALGTRMRGVGLGVMGCSALSLLVILFGTSLASPPYPVLLIMIAALTAGAALEAAGSLDLLIFWANRLFMRFPHYLTWLSPCVIYLLVLFTGTTHIIYALLPVIIQAAQRASIAPAKPLVAGVLASQQAILASPVSAAMAIVCKQSLTYTRGKLMCVLVPATLLGTLVSTWVVQRLHRDVTFSVVAEKKSDKKVYKPAPFARMALFIFLIGVMAVVATDYFFQQVRTKKPDGLTALMLFGVAGVISCFTGTKKIAQGRVFSIGMEAVVAILGIAWLSASFLEEHRGSLENFIQGYLSEPWQWGLLFFLTTMISTSQGATLTLMLPMALPVLGPNRLLFILPAVNSFYVIPSYPTILAAVALDKTGSTRIGRFVINHSFLLPGLAGTLTTCLSAYALSSLFG